MKEPDSLMQSRDLSKQWAKPGLSLGRTGCIFFPAQGFFRLLMYVRETPLWHCSCSLGMDDFVLGSSLVNHAVRVLQRNRTDSVCVCVCVFLHVYVCMYSSPEIYLKKIGSCDGGT